MRERRLREDRDGLGKVGKGEHVFGRLDAVHGVGSDSHRADCFLVALMADVDDAVALAGAHAHLVMHLGDERTDRVDDVAARLARLGDDLRGRAVRGQHQRRALGHLAHIVDEDHAESGEPIDDQLVVDDLVVAVHRRLEGPHHPRECLDRHLDPGAEASGRGEEHAIHDH